MSIGNAPALRRDERRCGVFRCPRAALRAAMVSTSHIFARVASSWALIAVVWVGVELYEARVARAANETAVLPIKAGTADSETSAAVMLPAFAQTERHQLASAWAGVAAALRGGDVRVAEAQLDAYIDSLWALGVRADRPAAMAIQHVGIEWAREGRREDARSLFLRAQKLDPGPGPVLARAVAASAGTLDQLGYRLASSQEALVAARAFPPTRAQLGSLGAFALTLALASAALGLSLGLSVRAGPLIARDLARALGAKPAVGLLWFPFALGLAIAVGCGLIPGALLLLVLASPYLARREQVAVGLLGVALAASPVLVRGASSAEAHVVEAARDGALECAQGLCSQTDAARLAVAVEHSEPMALLGAALVLGRGSARGHTDSEATRALLAKAVEDGARPALALVASANVRLAEWGRSCGTDPAEAGRSMAVAAGLYASALANEPNNDAAMLNLSFLKAREGKEAEAVALREQALQSSPSLRDTFADRSALLESGGCDTSFSAPRQLAWGGPTFSDAMAHAQVPAAPDWPWPAGSLLFGSISLGAVQAVSALLLVLAIVGPWVRTRVRMSWRCVECGRSRDGHAAATLASGPTCVHCVDTRRFAPWRGARAVRDNDAQQGGLKRRRLWRAKGLALLLPGVGMAALGHPGGALATQGALGAVGALAIWGGSIFRTPYGFGLDAALFWWTTPIFVGIAVLTALGAMLLRDPEGGGRRQ